MTLPRTSVALPSQAMLALTQANQRRSAAAECRRQLASFPRSTASGEAAKVLMESPGVVEALLVHKFLEAVPGVGPRRVRQLLGGAWPIWPLLTVGQLTLRQRTRIADRLRGLDA